MGSLLDKILDIRGIPINEREEFLSDKPKLSYDPFLIPDMEEGIELILKHINNKSKIMIYGDYDVDGITATSVMYTCLSQLTGKGNISFIIPSRFENGYSLNCESIKQIYDSGINLIITVDCGCTSVDEIDYANSLGLDVLVTDHHDLGPTLPNCLVINPKRHDSNYPFKELSGCGVSYKVLCALAKKGYITQKVKAEVLDLVLLGTVADVMPLVSENRTLVKYGLKQLKEKRRKGLTKLIESTQLKLNDVIASDLSYKIIPKINAIGRVSNATEAVNLMLSEDDSEIEKIVTCLYNMNTERQSQQVEAFKYAVKHVIDENGKCPNFIVMKIDDCNEGVLGLVAGNIKDTFNRPTILLTKSKDEDVYKGSGRSIDSINLHDILAKAPELFIRWGGHSQACGLSIVDKNIDLLKEFTNNEVEKIKKDNPDIFKKKEKFDLVIEKDDITLKNAAELSLLEPTGKGNEAPLFKFENVKFTAVYTMGKEKQHLKMYINNIECVFYNKADDYKVDTLLSNTYDVVCSLKKNEWNGDCKPQLYIISLTKK